MNKELTDRNKQLSKCANAVIYPPRSVTQMFALVPMGT